LKTEIEETLDYIYRQLGRLRVLNNLPKIETSSEALENRSRDVKSAAMVYIAVNLSHQCNKLGIGGKVVATVFLGDQTESSRPDLDKAIDEFNAELLHFGESIGFRTFDLVQGIH
jgi:phosphoribosylamine-glycine ligase